MINLNLNGVSNTFNKNSLFDISISFNGKKKTVESNTLKEIEVLEPIEMPVFVDRKTTFGGSNINFIDTIKDDIVLYLFIQKEKQYSAWNLISPVILEKGTGKIYQYRYNCFALEGSGGGLSNTSLIFYYLKKHEEKGFKVLIAPKIVDNVLLSGFEFVDSGIKLNDLLEKSIDLHNYRKDSFLWIHKQYQELIDKYRLIG